LLVFRSIIVQWIVESIPCFIEFSLFIQINFLISEIKFIVLEAITDLDVSVKIDWSLQVSEVFSSWFICFYLGIWGIFQSFKEADSRSLHNWVFETFGKIILKRDATVIMLAIRGAKKRS
jgi:hypothetical protein